MARAGMVLRENINTAEGRLMLAAGTAMTPQHLRLLKQLGVASVDVENDATRSATPADLAAEEERFRSWFILHAQIHPVSHELMRVYRKRKGMPDL